MRPQHRPGISSPNLSDMRVGSLTSPANHITLKMEETGPTVCSPYVGSLTSPANHITLKMEETGPTVCSHYPRRPQSLTIFSCHYKGNTFFSLI